MFFRRSQNISADNNVSIGSPISPLLFGVPPTSSDLDDLVKHLGDFRTSISSNHRTTHTNNSKNQLSFYAKWFSAVGKNGNAGAAARSENNFKSEHIRFGVFSKKNKKEHPINTARSRMPFSFRLSTKEELPPVAD